MSAAAETWLVTGASRGIGLAVVQAHLARGGQIVACVRGTPPPDLAALAPGDRLRIADFDLRDTAAVARAARAIAGPIDVLFNNAGVYGPRSPTLRSTDHAGMLDTFDINALGALRVVDAFLPQLLLSARPRIVAVSSLLGAMSRTGPGSLAYRVSKAALNKLMQTVAEELRPQGIAVACLRPGSVRTRMNDTAGQMSPAESAACMLALVDELAPANSPQFLDTNGASLDW